MISICIPIYNFDVKPLVSELDRQAGQCGIDYELILIDDASAEKHKKGNKDIFKKYNYTELSENIGRARIRNLFPEKAKYDYLLFLDCDSLIIRNDFIQKYVNEISNAEKDIICGGRIYEKEAPGRNRYLRWKYGIQKESQSAEVRKQFPNRSFMTNNFLIRKNIFSNIRFEESLSQYGHEDTLFGYELKKAGIPITHIDNPTGNGDIEENGIYLEKTRKGLYNLAYITKLLNFDEDFISEVKLLDFYAKMEKSGMAGFFHLLFRISRSILEFILKKGIVSLPLFDFYKWGYLREGMKHKQ